MDIYNLHVLLLLVVEMYTHDLPTRSRSIASTDVFIFIISITPFFGIELFCNTAAQEANLLVDRMPQTRIE